MPETMSSSGFPGPSDRPALERPVDSNLRVGVLGGTFDPVHIGHLILAEEARDQLDLAVVYFVPAGDPPHKRDRRLAPIEDRLRMIELATASNHRFEVSRVDTDRPGPHYTLDMVRIFQRQLPPGGQLYFLMGYDSLTELPRWHQPAELVAACHLVALTRYAVPLDWDYLEAQLPGIRQRVTLLDMPELEIASHHIQERVAGGRTIRYLVPEAVRKYIEERKLYVGEGESANQRMSESANTGHSPFAIRHSLFAIRHSPFATPPGTGRPSPRYLARTTTQAAARWRSERAAGFPTSAWARTAAPRP